MLIKNINQINIIYNKTFLLQNIQNQNIVKNRLIKKSIACVPSSSKKKSMQQKDKINGVNQDLKDFNANKSCKLKWLTKQSKRDY